jgi:glutathione synthase/RimK-type ligase-like ATP-grasp enzyme
MSKTILIVTNSADLHADLVVPILAAKGHRPFRIDLDAFPRDYQCVQLFGAGGVSQRIRSLNDGSWIDLDEVGAVWMRKAAEFSYRSAELAPQERAFAKLETEQAIFGLLYNLDCYWMSHPRLLRGAQWKGEQLKRAMRLGFRVPASIVTNSAGEARSFLQSLDGRMIFKTLSSPTLGGELLEPRERTHHGLGTVLVEADMVEQLAAVDELFCHFQEYVPKQYELRVTVIGERVFAAKIHSQDDPRTMIDSRNMAAEIPYEATRLPAEVAQRCVDFVHSYGLEYGAIDMIVTPAGDYVFLENNPCGQFLYIEQLIPEFKLLEAVADQLIGGAAACKR